MAQPKLLSHELLNGAASLLAAFGNSPLFRAIMEAEHDYRTKQEDQAHPPTKRYALVLDGKQMEIPRDAVLHIHDAKEPIEFTRLHRIIHNAGKNAGDLYVALNSYHKHNKAKGRNMRKAAELRDCLTSLSELLGPVDDPGLSEMLRETFAEASSELDQESPLAEHFKDVRDHPDEEITGASREALKVDAELREAHIFKMIKDIRSLIPGEKGGPFETMDKLQEVLDFIQYKQDIPTKED